MVPGCFFTLSECFLWFFTVPDFFYVFFKVPGCFFMVPDGVYDYSRFHDGFSRFQIGFSWFFIIP